MFKFKFVTDENYLTDSSYTKSSNLSRFGKEKTVCWKNKER